jgi:hypothetical protein
MNEFQGKATYYLYHRTGMGMEEFLHKFHKDNIIDIKVTATLSDGSVHNFAAVEMLEALITNFFIDGEEVFSNDIENKEKITKINPVIKLAI